MPKSKDSAVKQGSKKPASSRSNIVKGGAKKSQAKKQSPATQALSPKVQTRSATARRRSAAAVEPSTPSQSMTSLSGSNKKRKHLPEDSSEDLSESSAISETGREGNEIYEGFRKQEELFSLASEKTDSDYEEEDKESESDHEEHIEPESEEDSDTRPKKLLKTKGKKVAIRRKREDDDDVETVDLESLKSIDMNVPLIVVVTWNMEKYSKSGNAAKRKIKASKREAILRMLDTFHPTAIIMQEVTNADLLIEGQPIKKRQRNREEGLKDADLHKVTIAHYEAQNPGAFKKKRGREEEQDNPFADRQYPVGNEYGASSGPAFNTISYDKKNKKIKTGYQESYPLLFDKGSVIGTPKAYTFDPKKQELVPFEEGDTPIVFGRSDKNREKASQRRAKKENRVYKQPKLPKSWKGLQEDTNRQLVVWEIEIPAGRYNFRPNLKPSPSAPGLYKKAGIKFRKNRELPTRKMLLGVVHTSPSMDLRAEVDNIMLHAQKIVDEKQLPMLIGGDWYMQKANKEMWKKLESAKKASDWKLLAPHNITNFPGKEGAEGQIADHYAGLGVKELNTRAIVPSAHMETAPESHPLKPEDDLLKTWTDIKADHAPVMTVVELETDGKKIWKKPK